MNAKELKKLQELRTGRGISIPVGFRRLTIGEIIKQGDLYWSEDFQAFRERGDAYMGKPVGYGFLLTIRLELGFRDMKKYPSRY